MPRPAQPQRPEEPKETKSVYVSAIRQEMRTVEGIDAMLPILKTGSQGVWEWLQRKHTEKEIILTLRLLGYKIDPAVTGSDEEYQIFW